MKCGIVVAIVLAMAALAWAQAPAAAAQSQEVVLLVGSAYNSGGAPQVSGRVGGLYQFTPTTFGAIVADLGFRKGTLPQTTISGEFGRQIFVVSGVPVYALVDVGGSFAASDPGAILQKTGAVVSAVIQNAGTNVGYLAATGVGAAIHIGGNWWALPAVSVVKGSLNDTQLLIRLNFGLKVKAAKTP
jgi:hypothetical protein